MLGEEDIHDMFTTILTPRDILWNYQVFKDMRTQLRSMTQRFVFAAFGMGIAIMSAQHPTQITIIY